MNGTRTSDVKRLGDGNHGAIPRLGDGKTGPTRLITAGERAMVAAAAADAEVRRSRPPPAPEKAAEKADEKGEENSQVSGWLLIKGHAF